MGKVYVHFSQKLHVIYHRPPLWAPSKTLCTNFLDFDFLGNFLVRKPAKKGKNIKKWLFLYFKGLKIGKKIKISKTVHIVFEGSYKDDLYKLVANFTENCGFL